MFFLSRVTVITVLSLAIFGKTLSLECYRCSNVTKLQECRSTVTCSDQQVCYSKRQYTGQLLFDLGCSYKQHCGEYADTRNSSMGISMDGGQTHNCYECCSKELCNGNLCQHEHQSVCTDDESIDCATLNSMFSICKVVDQAKKICPKYCDLCHVVDGNWSPWLPWSDCDVTCDNGTQLRTRSCTNPAPQYGGLDCPGEKMEIKYCQKEICPVHGGWSEWGDWGTCSATCGVGMQSKTRSCINPLPDRHGHPCIGVNVDFTLCYPGLCTNVWSEWQSWSNCSVDCGGGVRTRIRTCLNPPTLMLAGNCQGNSIQSGLCNRMECNFTDCFDVLKNQDDPKSGVYSVTLWKSQKTIEVYCDMVTDGGGWTVFQYRHNGNIDFYRNFTEYEEGFGSLMTEFWLGLKNVQKMVSQGQTDLRVDLSAADGTSAYEIFHNFHLDDGTDYALRIDPGTGTAGDGFHGLTFNIGRKFSTYDNDRDTHQTNCAWNSHGAWWYKNCTYVNLNGQYDSTDKYYRNMFYYSYKQYQSVQVSKLMFRRV